MNTNVDSRPLGNDAGARCDNRALFVVGPGRSGTSAITRGLQALGVELGNQFKAANPKNPTGFFEDAELLSLGKRARTALGLKAESVALVPAEDWDRPELEPIRAKAVAAIKERFGDCPLWGFKYSQTLRFLPFWLPVLDEAGVEVDFVVAIRNPLAVAQSRAKLDPLRGRQEKSDLEWLVNVVPYFRILAQHRFAVVDYELLLEEPREQLTRVADELGIPRTEVIDERIEAFAAEFLDPSLQHNRANADELDRNRELNALTRDAYKWLHDLAKAEIRADNPEFWERWAEIERSLESMAPALRHVDYLETRVRHGANPIRESWRSLKLKWKGRWRDIAPARKTRSVSRTRCES